MRRLSRRWVSSSPVIETVGGVRHDGGRKKTDIGAISEEVCGRLLEKRLHLVEESIPIGFHRQAAFLGEFREQFLLPCRQLRGDLHFNGIEMIAGLAAFEAGNSEAFDSEVF